MNSQRPTPNAQTVTTKDTKRSKSTKKCFLQEEFKSFFVPLFLCSSWSSWLPAAAQAPEKITEIRVHGNHTTPDADMLRAERAHTWRRGERGAAEGSRAEAEGRSPVRGRRAAQALSVDHRSVAGSRDDRRRRASGGQPSDLTPGPFKKFRAMQMWMPILKHEDGYGFTYGARLAFKDSLGERSRLSVPMTWGGERRIGLEAERSFDGPISIVRGGVSLYRRVNPFFEVPDRRTEAKRRSGQDLHVVAARGRRRARGERPVRARLRPSAQRRGLPHGGRHAHRSVVPAQRDPHTDRVGAAALRRLGRPVGHRRARIRRTARRLAWCWRCARS